MKRRCTIALTFEVETKDWGGRDWHGKFARQSRDIVRAVNAMPKLTGTLRSAYLTADDRQASTHLNHTETGAPVADAPQVFSYCKECPNTSYCATQGRCARVGIAAVYEPRVRKAAAPVVRKPKAKAERKPPPPKKASLKARQAQWKKNAKAIRGEE